MRWLGLEAVAGAAVARDMAVAGVDMARAMTGAEVWWAGMWLWGWIRPVI